MPAFGSFVLLSALVVSACAFALSIVGARRRVRSLIDAGIAAQHLVTALMAVASAVMIHAFVTSNFAIKYVDRYSDSVQPMFYKLTSYWGGLDGSIMFWVTLLASFGSVAIQVNRVRYRELIPWVVATIAAVQIFFLIVMAVHNNPFATYLGAPPPEGRGLNPLLQNFYMAIHPPLLYLGFVGMTIPFAFGIAALASGHLDDAWLRAVRRWTMTAWLFLTVGLALGGLWAYEELGWGGFWGWDPVENAGLLPWFTGTAFLHSVMVQEKRGMLKIWNVSLVILTFLLTIFGTFMTRTGIVQSVHAFGEDRELAWMFTVFMLVITAVSFGLVIYRMPLLRSRNELDSWASREAAFLANNWILLFSAFFVLFATMFPTLSEAVTGQRITVGPAFFDQWMLPIGLILLALTGIGPLMGWRKSSLANLREQFMWPVSAAALTLAVLMPLGVHFWASGLCFALCAFTFSAIAQEFVRGARVRQRSTGTDLFTALVGLFARSRRRYAGYIVHVGIVILFLGFAGGGFKQTAQKEFRPGDQLTVGDFTLQYEALRVADDAQKQMITADVRVSKDGEAQGVMQPARWFFRGRESEPTTEVAIRRGFAEDLYIVLAGYQATDQSAILDVTINPLINWIWAGIAMMFIGTMIALLPEHALAFAVAKVPEGAVTTMLVIGLALSPGVAFSQHIEVPSNKSAVLDTPLSRELGQEIICMCGDCGRKRVGECFCPKAAEMREEIAKLVGEGKNRDEVYAYFIAKYGSQEPLAKPLDTGFNRLAWLFPYLVGAGAAALVFGTAFRWSRRRTADGAPEDAAPVNPALRDRLDDELDELE
ncbi:MAG: cytochrome c-type biogenesis CcmF C-terminal domain-containing protein [Vicinamibacterales bacterium]